jgi:hypothetical protein
MGELAFEYRRPADDDYWTPAWASITFAGDVYQAIPFGGLPVDMVETDEDEHGPAQHFIGPIEWGYGLLVSPTCDMYEALEPPRIAHPYRVLVPVIEIDALVASNPALAQEGRRGLLTQRDSIYPYMYLPPLPGFVDGESVACLFRPVTLSDGALEGRRVAQLSEAGRRHLKYKLATYWGRVRVRIDDFAGREKNEDKVRSGVDPPSSFDAPERFLG